MGSVFRVWKTMPMPVGATVSKNGTVTWTAKGKKRTGKLSKTGNVTVQVDTWTAKFRDENDKIRCVPTKTTIRSVAEGILAQHEKEVARIKTGVITRAELDKAQVKQKSLDELLEQFRTKMVADGSTAQHIHNALQRITILFARCEIDSVASIRRETVERWVANELTSKIRSMRTINSYVTSVKSFVQYLVDTGVLVSHPLKSIRQLNSDLDRRIERRAMTEDEINRLLRATASGICRPAGTPEERVLIYQLLLGTGLRSTELSLLTPGQIDFDRCRMRIEAAKTKNKKADVLPLRLDLVQTLKKRIETIGIKPHERIFHHDQVQIRRAFYADLKTAGIERIGSDGRCLDVHSLRKTFGTMLANAGVPLTTTQRLMRHSNPQITAKLYVDVDPMNMMQALDQLPKFSG